MRTGDFSRPLLRALMVLGTAWLTVAPAAGSVGSETCALCHEEVVAAFPLTGHGIAPGWDAAGACESCHGPGDVHAESGDPDDIVRPQMLPARDVSESCLECHSGQRRQFTPHRSIHQLSDVGCIDCHNPHSTAGNMLAKSGVELCAGCHQAVVSQFGLPRAHPLGGYPRSSPGQDRACAACHEPHATNSLRMQPGFGSVACVECHSEKRGPFVYNHDASMIDGCGSCHQVHGSLNRHLLTHSRQVNLCYQCHPGTTTPGFHNAPAFLNEKCTACHTAIHGSNTHPAFLEE